MKSVLHCFLTVLWLMALSVNDALAGPGAWDKSYAATVSGGAVYATVQQPDGKLIVGGAFTSVNGSTARVRLARLYSDGLLDTTFFNTGSGVSGIVWCLTVQTDGRIVIGGDFTSINGTSRNRIARLNSNGTVDGSFVPTNIISSSVLAVAVQTNNTVVIGGTFSGGAFPSYNARLNADGTTDTAFASFPNGPVYAIANQSDGKIVIGGNFTTVNGAARNRIARLNADGSLDNTFQNGLTGASSSVRCVQIQSDGKILIGGDFTTVNGTTRSYVARLNSNGSLDTGFNSAPGANGSVYALAVQTDNNIVIGGNFSTYASTALSRVARLYPDGTRDTTFTNFGINNIVQAIALQSDGGLLIGGTFTTINNTNFPYLGRLYGNQYPPEFVIQPVSRATNIGANVTFSAQVSNPTITSFQWRKDGNNIPGATGTSYSLFNVQLVDVGNYSVFVNNAVGGTTSSNALLQVGIAPSFTAPPSSLTVTQGQSANFTVGASGTSLNYSWRKNGTVIAGATNTTFNIPAAFGSNAATYTVVVSNFLSSITSTGAILTVIVPAGITGQPTSQTVGEGSNTTFTVTATGTALSYQWFKDGTNISGATAASYAFNNVQFSDAADYTVMVSNILTVVTSQVATLTVQRYAPAITVQPASQNQPLGSNAIFTVVATGTTLNYQWLKNETNALVAATGPSLSLTNLTLSDAGGYSVVITNPVGSVTSVVVNLNVGYAPVVVQQPLSLTNSVGGTVAFSCTVTGTPPINLQWLFYGTPLAGQTNATLALTNLQASDVGNYVLAATNFFGTTVSSNATLILYGYNPLNGLVGYYPFDGNANDQSGNGNNALVYGAQLATNRFGRWLDSYSFTAVNHYIETTNSVGFPSSMDDFTVSVWLKLDQLKTDDHQIIFCNRSQNQFQLGLNPFTGDTTALDFWNGTVGGPNPDCRTASMPWVLNQWYNLMVVRSNNTITIYRDGSVIGSDVTANGNAAAAAQRVLDFGYRAANNNHQFYGQLDDIRIYNRALAEPEVWSLFLSAEMPRPSFGSDLISSPFGFNINGLPGRDVIIEASEELQAWIPIATNLLGGGTNHFSDLQSTNFPKRFYRLRY